MGISRVQQKLGVVALPYTLIFMFMVMFLCVIYHWKFNTWTVKTRVLFWICLTYGVFVNSMIIWASYVWSFVNIYSTWMLVIKTWMWLALLLRLFVLDLVYGYELLNRTEFVYVGGWMGGGQQPISGVHKYLYEKLALSWRVCLHITQHQHVISVREVPK